MQRQPAAHRVAAQDEALGLERREVGGDGAERGGAALRRVAVAREVGREAAVAFPERRGHRGPAATGLREPVQQDELRRHAQNSSMTPTDTYLGLRAFVDELARCGVREACTSPGSRNTPLLLSLAREPRLRATSHIDERCGGFFALGLAKATQAPVVLACTSGTAAANYLPAVVEAWEARVPLLVLTADRPPELRDLGAGQTIDQVKLYGRNAKWYLEVDDAPATPERLRWLRQLACRAVWTATSGRPGPVHLNFSLREPLVLDEPLPDDDSGRPDGRPWTSWARPTAAAPDALLAELDRARAADHRRRPPRRPRRRPRAVRHDRHPAARRPAVQRPPRRRGRPLRPVPARRGVGGRARARPRDPRRRPADVEAAAPVARRARRAPGRAGPARRVAGAVRRRRPGAGPRPRDPPAAADGGAASGSPPGGPPTTP